MTQSTDLRTQALQLLQKAFFIPMGKRRFLSLYVREKANNDQLKKLVYVLQYQDQKFPEMIERTFQDDLQNVKVFNKYFQSLGKKLALDAHKFQRSAANKLKK